MKLDDAPSAAGRGALEPRAIYAHPRSAWYRYPSYHYLLRATTVPAYLLGYLIQVSTCLLGPARTVYCDGPCTQVSQSSLSWPIYRRSRHRRGPTKKHTLPVMSFTPVDSPPPTSPTPHPLHPAYSQATLCVIALRRQGTKHGTLVALAVPCRKLSWDAA